MKNRRRALVAVVLMVLALSVVWAGGDQEAEAPSGGEAVPTSQYSEAPVLAEMVAAGELPPVEERLPENPYVEDAPEIGTYCRELKIGGTYDIESPWNSYTTGANFYNQAFAETLLISGMPEQGMNEPSIAESYEVSDDGLEITFHLREGVKWSDGEEFTTEDIMFTYYDVVLNGKINTGRRNNYREVSAEEPVDEDGFVDIDPDNYVQFEQIDDYTFKVITREPNVKMLNQVFTPGLWWNDAWLPKHQMTKYHPDFNDEATIEDWNNARRPGATDEPIAVLGPWVPTEVAGGNILVMERNPYYFKVDAEGNQLPYPDRMIARRYLDREGIALGVIAGEVDFYLYEQQSGQYAVLKQQEARGEYTVYTSPIAGAQHTMVFNLDTPDEGLANLFANQGFIDALNHAVDREEAANLFTRPLITICNANLPAKGTPGYDAELYTEYAREYDPERAATLLEESGIVDSDGDGLREFPDGNPRAGEPVEFTVMVNTAHSDRLKTAEVAVEDLEELGLTVYLKTLDSSIYYPKLNNPDSADYEASVFWGCNPIRPVFQPHLWVPMAEGASTYYAPLSTTRSEWRLWQIEVKEIIEETLASTIDYSELLAGIKEAYPILATNLPQVPILVNTTYFVVADKLGNNVFKDFSEVIAEEGFGRIWAEGFPRHMRLWRMYY